MHRYKPDEMRTTSYTTTPRTREFEEKIFAMWRETGRPVPYLFALTDGTTRSLDWGCIGQLTNLRVPELRLYVDGNGYVDAVEPIGGLAERYKPIEDRLRAGARLERQSSPADQGALRLDDMDFDALENDERERVDAESVVREGTLAFRADIMRAWEGRCGLSGCGVEQVLDAAHMRPYLGLHTNLLCNGILLRADLHRLFDRGLLAFKYVDSRLVVVTSPKLAGSDYEAMQGRAIPLPKDAAARPHPKIVGKCYAEFLGTQESKLI